MKPFYNVTSVNFLLGKAENFNILERADVLFISTTKMYFAFFFQARSMKNTVPKQAIPAFISTVDM